MKYEMLAIVGAYAVAGCTVNGASAEPQGQTQQAQSTTTDGAADGRSAAPGHHQGPPPEAFEACASKAVGDACTVVLGKDSLSGKCVAPPSDAPDTRIVCRPDRLPDGHGSGGHGSGGHPHGSPPPEVFNACEGKVADAACSVKFGDREIAGTCKAPPQGSTETRLGCAPARPAR